MIQVDEGLWRRRKEEFRSRIFEDLEIGYLDRDIIDVLLKFFDRDKSFTLSSCSGRISIVDAPFPWVRDPSSVIFKKHSLISPAELRKIIMQPSVWRMWGVVTGPIIHVSTLTLNEALEILEIGREAGMKHSGILSVGRKGIVVELKTGVMMTSLLKVGKDVVIRDENIAQVVETMNSALMSGKEKLNRLREVLGLKPFNYGEFWRSTRI